MRRVMDSGSGAVSKKPGRNDERAEKLADRLRENLKKRKQQARGRVAGDGPDRPPHTPDAEKTE